ncbi:unnamed protein product [Lampetra planeri]
MSAVHSAGQAKLFSCTASTVPFVAGRWAVCILGPVLRNTTAKNTVTASGRVSLTDGADAVKTSRKEMRPQRSSSRRHPNSRDETRVPGHASA